MTPCYKTLSLRLYAPGRAKRALLENAVLRYTRALEILLRQNREQVCALVRRRHVTRGQVNALLDTQAMRALDGLAAEPFKDSLRVEFTGIVLAFLARCRRSGGHAAYPCVRLEKEEAVSRLDTLLDTVDTGTLPSGKADAGMEWILAHSGRLHPLYFGRYAARRDYCLLYSPRTRRFFAKLHLCNAAGRLPSPPNGTQELCMVAPGLPPARDSAARRRYLIVPLLFGKRQEAVLRRALAAPRILRTARLVQRENGAFDLVVSVEVQPGPAVRPLCTLGLARARGGLYAALRRENRPDETRFFPAEPAPQSLARLVCDVAALAADRHAQVVMERDGGRGDGLTVGPDTAEPARPFPVWLYARLTQLLRCRLVEAGLPEPILVSARGLPTTCPACGHNSHKNRLTARLFLCTACGHALPAPYVAGINLAARPARYTADRIPLTVRILPDGSRRCFNRTLGFSCTLPPQTDEAQLYYELRLFVSARLRVWNAGEQYAMLCKLHAAPDLRAAVRLVRRSSAGVR